MSEIVSNEVWFPRTALRTPYGTLEGLQGTMHFDLVVECIRRFILRGTMSWEDSYEGAKAWMKNSENYRSLLDNCEEGFMGEKGFLTREEAMALVPNDTRAWLEKDGGMSYLDSQLFYETLIPPIT